MFYHVGHYSSFDASGLMHILNDVFRELLLPKVAKMKMFDNLTQLAGCE
jgi:hypothetical protein